MYKLIADSSCDMNEMPGIDFVSVPLTLSTIEKEYVDNADLDVLAMMDYMTTYKGKSSTACPSSESWLNAFQGSDEIYVVTITSGLSGTYNSANVAKDMYLSEHPEAKILVIDSLSTGPEMRMILEKIAELKKQGKTFEEVSTEIQKYTSKTRLFFSFQSLHNLAQNGRVNKVLASALGMLHISIIGTANEKGVIEPIGKCRGEKSLISSFIKELKKAGFQGGKIRICHAENESLALSVVSALKELFPSIDALVYPARGLCSFYVERGGIILGCEC